MSCKGLHRSRLLLADTSLHPMHPCCTEGHQVSASHSAKLSHPGRNPAANKVVNQQHCLWCSSSLPSAPPLGFHRPFLKMQEMCSWEQMTALKLAMGEPGWRSPFLTQERREISSADGTGSAPLSSLGGFVFAPAAHLSPSFLRLLLPWMKGSEKEPQNVTLRDCFDAGTGRAESLACDKPGVTSTLLTCIGPAFSHSTPEPPQPRQPQHHGECDGKKQAGSSQRDTSLALLCVIQVSLFRGYHIYKSKMLNLMVNENFAEMQLSHQCKLASFYLSRKHQADASPTILLFWAAFWLPWWVHPLLCFFWVFLLSFPFSRSLHDVVLAVSI